MRDMRGNRNMALKNLVNQKATMDDTKMLQISHLKEYPDNEYVFGMEGIERLANGIESNGFKGAIEVWDMGNGEYISSMIHFVSNKLRMRSSNRSLASSGAKFSR